MMSSSKSEPKRRAGPGGSVAIAESCEAFPLAVVIFARDEADVIEPTLTNLRFQLGSSDQLHVVADHCRDETAAIADSLGATIHRRRTGVPGKGQALSWWVGKLAPVKPMPKGIVILDADSSASPTLLSEVRSALRAGHPVVQAKVVPALENEDPISALTALSEYIEQRVFDPVRQLFGAPIRLRGTGMAFRTEVLQPIAGQLKTSIEDAEMSLLLMAAGIQPHPLAAAAILDPKPIDGQAASRQRARWLQGQWQLVSKQPSLLLRVARRGPAGWALLSSLLLKPRILMLPFLGALAGLGFVMGASTGWLSLMLLIPFLLNLVGLVIGFALAPPDLKAVAWRALPRSHRFMVMWLRSLQLAHRSRDPWLRARTRVKRQPMGEATTAGQ